jgi:SPOR domain
MKFITLFTLLLIIGACTSPKQLTVPKVENKSSKYDESFDPNTLNDDDIVIAKLESKKTSGDKIETQINTIAGEIKYKEADGFRVQLVATKSIETASLTEQEATDIFAAKKQKIYLIFDAPQYKVRVGDFLNRSDAEEIRDLAKDYGYRDAFIVLGKVNIPLNGSF